MASSSRPKDLPRDYIISNVEVHEDQVLGEGAYGIVKVGTFYGLQCAVKKLKPSMFPAGMKQLDQQTELILQSFYNECEKMSQIRHPNVIQLLGVFSDQSNKLPVIVMELMTESLSRLLHRTKVLPFYVDINIVHDVAKALAYLHSFRPPIVHRDLSSNNILLDESFKAKITDLGVAKVAKGSFLGWDDTPAPGTMVYMPPEVRKVPADLTPAMDIFAVGVNMIQIRTHLFPRPGPEFASGRLGFSKMVPEKDRRRDHLALLARNDPVKQIILDCIRDNPRERPSAMKLCERLQKVKMGASYTESLQLSKAKSSGSDESNEQLILLEQRIAQLSEDLSDKTNQVERLESELTREREYTAQVMEQSTRDKLKYELALAGHSAASEDSGISNVTTPTSTTGTAATSTTSSTTSTSSTKKKRKFKLKKLLRRKQPSDDKQSQSLPPERIHKRVSKKSSSSSNSSSEHENEGSKSTSSRKSKSSHKSRSPQSSRSSRSSRITKSYNCEERKLSATAEPIIDITEVVVEEEEEEEEEDDKNNGHKPLAQRTKHDYKLNKMTWYTHNCLPVGLKGITLQVHQIADALCVCGGVTEDNIPNKALFYCPINNVTRWSRSSSDVPQYSSASVVIQDEVVLIGGISAVDGKCTGALSSYDFKSHVWVHRYPSLPTPRSFASAFVYADYLVVIGGRDESGKVVGVVEVLHLPTQSWETSARLAVPVAGASTVICGNAVYLLGGVGASGYSLVVQSASARKILSSCHRFSILSSLTAESSRSSIWKQVQNCPFIKMTALCSGDQLLAFGGEQVTQSAYAAPAEWIWIYDQTDNIWSPIQGMPSPRSLCAVVMLPDSNIVILGGAPDYTKIDIAEIL